MNSPTKNLKSSLLKVNRRSSRVSKACDYCRRKKLKCDGETPCIRCSKFEAECTYNYVEKKRSPRVQKPIFSTKSSSKLGELIQTAVNDHIDDEDTINHNTNTQNKGFVEARLDKLESMIEILLQRSSPTGPYSRQQVEQSDEPLDQPDQLGQTLPDYQNYNGQYFGSHCSFSIFSPKGISYISQRCEEPHAMDRVVKMLRDVYSVLYSQYKKRVEPAPATDVIAVPRRDLSTKLVDAYISSSLYVNSIFDENELRDRFTYYYANEEHGANKRELRQSDYLILHAICGLGAMSLVEKLSKETTSDINEIQFYRQVEEKHIMCALYFFHRLTIYGDGIHGVKSILLLISYVESSLIPDTDYLLVSSVIRFGQSIGLHRKESMLGLPDSEIVKRKRIWLNCYVFDKDLCLKSGKSPIINEQDVSSLAKEEHQTFLNEMRTKTSLKLRITVKRLNLDNPNHLKEFLRTLVDSSFGVAKYFENLRLKIARISSSAYFCLFSATALDGKTKKDVMKIVQSLNDQFYLLKESIPKSVRPGFKITLPPMDSDAGKALIYSQVVKFQFSFHLNVMNINRIGLNKEWEDGEVCENLCLESAREIMRISQDINPTDAHLYLCSLFVILSANVTLLSYIVKNPRNLSVKSDLLLMSKTSDLQRMKFIKLQYDPISTMKFLSIIYIIKNFIKIGLDFYNKMYNDINYKSSNYQEESFDITNNSSDIAVLEAELDEVFTQIEQKHGFSRFIKQRSNDIYLHQFHQYRPMHVPVQRAHDPLSTATNSTNHAQMNTYMQRTVVPNDGSVNTIENSKEMDKNNMSKSPNTLQIYGADVSPNSNKGPAKAADDLASSLNTGKTPENFTLAPVPTQATKSHDEEKMIDELLDRELLDMSYFSQPLFNIPNFLLNDH